ncbi:phosphoserine phosphatase SerB [Sphingorhabdus lutea]|uniref:Phosphoserine phosphatase n=1 Tax=Sphingorhabdus lutea TaxID=1913578 RepID=A0A1L3JCX3_9SPHN|nr:phosphoserine phosphatase SerB [Sphingorhabdus lutea]APG62913.1 phosphoserine phosphatase SerB [Sphingorhabdus lutea]
MIIATIIGSNNLDSVTLGEAVDSLCSAGIKNVESNWIEEGKAADIMLGDLTIEQAAHAKTALTPMADKIDFLVQDDEFRRKSLIVSDMDSTIITVECIDELADYAGIKAQIAEITEAAMQGKLDFEQALRGRVALLEGLDAAMIDICLKDRVRLTPGAEILVKTMKSWGAHSILVSGGFTAFAAPVAQMAGFDEFYANILEMENGNLTGGLEGEIVDACYKAYIMDKIMSELGIDRKSTLAVGDGANDIPMIEFANLGVAYHAKPRAEAAANGFVRHNDLTALLYFQGVPSSAWMQ